MFGLLVVFVNVLFEVVGFLGEVMFGDWVVCVVVCIWFGVVVGCVVVVCNGVGVVVGVDVEIGDIVNKIWIK